MPCTSELAQLPTPAMASRSRFLSLMVVLLRGDQTVEPRDVALDGLGVVLGQGAEIAICDRPGPAIGKSLRQRVTSPLQQCEPNVRFAVPAEGELHVERTLVVGRVGDELAQACLADLG